MKHFLTFAALLATSLAFGQDGCCALMDYDGDRNVSISDFTILLSNYGADDVSGYTDCIPCYTSVVFDADQQGEIGLSDLLIMLSLFGSADVDFDLIWDSVDECFDINSCNFMDVLADECIYPDVLGICGGQCLADNDEDGICDDEDGCSDSNACNFMNPASIECVYQDALGICGGPCELDIDGDLRCDDIDNCTDIEACNYLSPSACACSYGDTESGCVDPGDIDGDGVCDFQDACFDVEACNYAAYPTSHCTYDFDGNEICDDEDTDYDGIWDSQDYCLDLEACNYDSDPSEPCAYLDVLGTCGGDCDGDADGDGVCDDVDTCMGGLEECGDPMSYQGYDYETVQIGDRCWFAENLRNENYENGDPIPSSLSDNDWSSTTSGAVTVFGEGSSVCTDHSPDGDACDETWSLNEYGRLYNWYAVEDVRGLCPSGWHVPTDGEWTALTDHLGGEGLAGVQMKTDYGWSSSWGGDNGTNSSGFSGVPGSSRDYVGSFIDAGINGCWWSSSPIGFDAWWRLLTSYDETVLRLAGSNSPCNGFSVRCVRDCELE